MQVVSEQETWAVSQAASTPRKAIKSMAADGIAKESPAIKRNRRPTLKVLLCVLTCLHVVSGFHTSRFCWPKTAYKRVQKVFKSCMQITRESQEEQTSEDEDEDDENVPRVCQHSHVAKFVAASARMHTNLL